MYRVRQAGPSPVDELQSEALLGSSLPLQRSNLLLLLSALLPQLRQVLLVHLHTHTHDRIKSILTFTLSTFTKYCVVRKYVV